MIAPDRPPSGFYVYLLVDPRDQRPFYVGKGQRWRAWQHERCIRAGKPGTNRAKVERIQQIIDAGLSVTIAIVGVYDLESQALNMEFKIVDASPDILNVAPGGGGVGLSAKETHRRLVARKLQMQRIKARERAAAALDEVRERRQAMLALARTDDERAAVGAWLDGLSGDVAERMIAPKLVQMREEADARAAAEKRAREKAQREGLSRKGKSRKLPQFGRMAMLGGEINPADYVIR